MYKAKIINLEGVDSLWISKHKVGDIIEFADCWLPDFEKMVKVIEHYKMVTTSKNVCKECGSLVIKRKKKILKN